MFLGRDEIEYRRHAVAQFWSSTDPAYLAWFLKRFRVGFRLARGKGAPVGKSRRTGVRQRRGGALESGQRTRSRRRWRRPMAIPESIPMGGRGQPYFGTGWNRDPQGSLRGIPPGRAKLYLPSTARSSSTSRGASSGGELRVEGSPPLPWSTQRSDSPSPPSRARPPGDRRRVERPVTAHRPRHRNSERRGTLARVETPSATSDIADAHAHFFSQTSSGSFRRA